MIDVENPVPEYVVRLEKLAYRVEREMLPNLGYMLERFEKAVDKLSKIDLRANDDPAGASPKPLKED